MGENREKLGHFAPPDDDQAANKVKADQAKPEEKESIVSFIASFALLFFLVFAFKSTVLDANNIPSGSMIPTLKIGDYLFVNKMRYSLRIPYTNREILRIADPHRGDIITFIPPPPADEGKHYVKRVTGMPGDRFRIRYQPACELYEQMVERGSAPIEPPEREFSCKGASDTENDTRLSHSQPYVSLIEYRKNDQGPWLDYSPVELAAKEAIRELGDSDNAQVLHPDQFPGRHRRRELPVLYNEQSGGKSYYIVETARADEISRAFEFPESVNSRLLCREIHTEGCLIPEGYYFAMGDNRDDSRDSRFIGPIERERILGKAVMIYFSINWRDEICAAHYQTFYGSSRAGEGFDLPGFTVEQQNRYCTQLDTRAGFEGLGDYFNRTLFYRLPRMSVRWDRIGKLLH